MDVHELERRIAALETRNAVDDVHRRNAGNRLESIEGALQWLVRLIIGGLVLTGLTYAVQGGFMV
tara:strand:+ start:12536 stop:12730 length:195 start_codon:yes stop_codon:yes gene_type:complete